MADVSEQGGASPRRFPYRRLLALARPEWRTIALGTLFLIVGGAMELLYPQAIRVIIDEVVTRKNFSAVDATALALVGIFLVQSVAVALRFYLFTLAGERVVTRLRESLYRKILEQEVAFFDQRRTGELTNRLASDTTVLQNTVSTNISMLLRNLASVVGSVALLLYTSPSLALLMLLTVPPVSLGTVFIGRKLRKLSRQVQDALASASEIAEETFSGVRTVRSFTQEPGEVKRYKAAIWKAFSMAKKRTSYSALFSAGATFVGFSTAAGVFWYGGRLVIDGVMTVGDLTSFLLYTLILAFALGSLSGLWVDFMRSVGATERIFEILERRPAIPPSGGLIPEKIEGAVTFEGVRFVYPARPDVVVLKGVDFSLAPGEIVALVGPSGSGKSTIASLISRLYDPTEGRVLLDQKDIRDLEPTWLRRQIGVVAQEPILFSCSIAENIRYGREDANDEEIEAAARAANAHEFIQNFPEKYQTQVGERGIQLSGGQKQRIAIARAVLKNPKVLILDEATSALDAESEFLVKEALDRLMQGRTTLVIAHRLSTVKDAHRVLVVSEGQIVQSGRHDALLQEEGLYRRLVQRQFVVA